MKQFTVITLLILCFISETTHAKAYTVENTYKKLIKQYPNITIPVQDNAADVSIKKGLIYKTINQQALTLTLFSPKQQQASLPLVVLVHGGGWRTGTPALFNALAIRLAQNGFVVATPSYRLSGVAPFPAAIYDVNDALIWLRAHHQDFAIDLNHIALGGGSAGGQIAALLAYNNGQLKQQAEQATSANVQALINIDGLSDFASDEALPFENDPSKKVTSASAWLGGRYEQVPERWHSASPINYITDESPATLFINSSVPRFRAGRDTAIMALKKHQVVNQIYQFADAPHSFWLFDPWLNDTVKIMTEFLTAQLKLQN
ncbi:alpha/beta hydrolase [Pseudoalteromonas sp. 10-33]|uniref:alpha/beta hydrolase n=1 Tax=Pseudoalteromonas sp. 10-33 TaxID=1761890 RepID=UPI00073219D7|nr:alpha/beta hydrolase [Pseudoalteromonas sp. 10-33]KTF17837.1 esterase [Pseudoalteromonas sp. 10-33]